MRSQETKLWLLPCHYNLCDCGQINPRALSPVYFSVEMAKLIYVTSKISFLL